MRLLGGEGRGLGWGWFSDRGVMVGAIGELRGGVYDDEFLEGRYEVYD